MTPLRERSQLAQAAIVNGCLLAIMWVLEVIDTLAHGALDQLGIRPRDPDTVWSILTAPWLHLGFGHLISNSIPFFVLGFFILSAGWREWLAATGMSVLVGGMAVWLFAAPGTLTLGASGVVFGWFGYLALRGFLSGDTNQVIISVLVLLLYGGLIFGVLPGGDYSWQGHLGGLAGGLLAAWLLHGRRRTRGFVSLS